jgi:DNA-binding response OmpR family regulator
MVPKVLLLEPHADLRAEIAATLRRERYACDAVGSADDAAIQLRERAYAYVVIDLDATGSASVMATVDPESHVILLSGDDDERSALRKPFGRAELLARFS